jgi:hypothetical protein
MKCITAIFWYAILVLYRVKIKIGKTNIPNPIVRRIALEMLRIRLIGFLGFVNSQPLTPTANPSKPKIRAVIGILLIDEYKAKTINTVDETISPEANKLRIKPFDDVDFLKSHPTQLKNNPLAPIKKAMNAI